ncbi:MAG: HEAT repeat domain-containing protein [Planctomycetes bacterium]|nr:HEAT repeat domain-containing protein [Planctomycetota bacterium]
MNRRMKSTLPLSVLAIFVLVALPAPAGPRGEEAAMSEDEAFSRLKSYRYGEEDQALHRLEEITGRAAAEAGEKSRVAGRLAALLADPETAPAAKTFILKLLRIAGTEAEVPLLEKLLDRPETRELARGVLEAIPGAASLRALRRALGRFEGDALAGAIHSLGARGDAESVPALLKLLGGAEAKAARAAAWALGQIGGRAAAEALLKAQPAAAAEAQAEIADGLLRAAERLDGKEIYLARRAYDHLFTSGKTSGVRAAAIQGLARIDGDGALPAVLEALRGDDPVLQGAAARCAAEIPGPRATAALVQALGRLQPAGQAKLIEALARRGDRSAREAVAALTASGSEAVRIAAAEALARLGDASSVVSLARLAASSGAAGAAAFESLTRLSGEGVDAAVLAGARAGEPLTRAVLLRAAAERSSPGAEAALLEAAQDRERPVRLAALEALAACGTEGSYRPLIDAAAEAQDGAEKEAFAKAIFALGGRLADPAGRLKPLQEALETSEPAAQAFFLGILGAIGGPQALEAVRARLSHSNPAVREAAHEAQIAWPEASATEALLELAGNASERARRLQSLQSYLRLAQAAGGGERARLFEKIRSLAAEPPGKRLLLEGLAGAAAPEALAMAVSYCGDAEAGREAVESALKIAEALVLTQPAAVREPMSRLLQISGDGAAAERAKAILADAARAPADPKQALQRDAARSQARKQALAKQAPRGFHLAAYLDCGPDTEDGTAGGSALRLVSGQPHIWEGSDRAGPLRCATIAFDAQQVLLEAAGLKAERAYRLGFSWWDYDSNGRIESVWISTGKGERERKVLDQTLLPGFLGQNQPPQEKTVAVPRDLYADGALRLAFRNERGPNAVLSEAWLWEKGEGGAAAADAPVKKIRVLLLTGNDYPGHQWRLTAPVVAEGLRRDPRLEVEVIEKPEFLASPELHGFDAIVLHWMNWETPDPGPRARDNLKKFVEGGKGLFLIHFACGAFQDWPEFRDIVGRTYDPKLPPHDPYGPFRVELAAPEHPILKGLKSFETTDELYTCLAGDQPIEILATARSKVTGKDHPMAFVRPYGKGRVFLSPLGHDVKALSHPQVLELFRRACAWAGGLPPAPEAEESGGAEKTANQ